MGSFSVSLHAVSEGKVALCTWKMGKTESTSVPSGVVSRLGILEVLLG